MGPILAPLIDKKTITQYTHQELNTSCKQALYDQGIQSFTKYLTTLYKLKACMGMTEILVVLCY
jgi:hypothetical protein